MNARHLILVAAGLSLAGCATLDDWLGTAPGAGRQKARTLTQLPVQPPLDAHRFRLESPEQSVVGAPQLVFTQPENALPDFAREYGLGYDELIAANPGVDVWMPGDKTPVLLPSQFVLPDTPREGIVLNIAAKRLYYFPADGVQRDPETGEILSQLVLTFPIGIGRVGWETPLGETEVTAKAVDPHWWVPKSVRDEHAAMGDPLPAVVPPGPDNPLGSRVLKLGMPGYLIHGTNQPYGVGMRVSHGCVRLYPENIEFLYELIAIGEPVTIVNQPYLLGRQNGDWYFAAYPPLEDDEVAPADRLDALLAAHADELDPALSDHVRALASEPNGVAVRVGAADAGEVFARVRRVENTVEPDPDAPTLEEVRQMIDEAVAEAASDSEASP